MDAVQTGQRQLKEQDRFPTFRAWGRLLWKEWREGWPILAVGVVLPLLTLPMSGREGWTNSGLDYSVMGLVGILLVLWAADRARRIGMDRGPARQALPVPAPARWIFLHLAPLAIPALVGAALGIMIGAWHAESIPLRAAITAAVLYMLSTFLLATMLSPVLSMIPALIIGVVWLFFGMDLVRWGNVTPLFLKVIVLALVASLLWEAFSRARWVWTGRVVVILLLLTAFVTPGSLRNLTHRPDAEQDQSSFEFPITHTPVVSDDGLQEIEFGQANDEIFSNSVMFYTDDRDRTRFNREFPYFTRPLDYISGNQILLGRQAPGERVVHLSVWDAHTDQVREKGRFSAVKDLLARTVRANFSPDGRYLLLIVQSQHPYSQGPMFLGDLWIADLAHGRAVPVMANVLLPDVENPPMSWTSERLYLSEYNILVELRTLRGRCLKPTDFGRMP